MLAIWYAFSRIHTYTHTHVLGINKHTHIRTYIHACNPVPVPTLDEQEYLCIHIHMHIHIHTYTDTYMRTDIHSNNICTYTYTYIYIYTHTCIRLRDRKEAGQINAEDYKVRRKKVRRHYKKLLKHIGADDSLIESVFPAKKEKGAYIHMNMLYMCVYVYTCMQRPCITRPLCIQRMYVYIHYM